MKKLIVSIACVLFVIAGVIVLAQTRATVLCKGEPVPEGFVISGETLSDKCNGTAWIIKPRPGARPGSLDRFTTALENDGEVTPKENIAPGQCAACRPTNQCTHSCTPRNMNPDQIRDQSAKLDVFWNSAGRWRNT